MENKSDGGKLWMYKIREKNKDTRKCILCMLHVDVNGKDQIKIGKKIQVSSHQIVRLMSVPLRLCTFFEKQKHL